MRVEGIAIQYIAPIWFVHVGDYASVEQAKKIGEWIRYDVGDPVILVPNGEIMPTMTVEDLEKVQDMIKQLTEVA